MKVKSANKICQGFKVEDKRKLKVKMNSKVLTCALITDLRGVIIYPDKKDEAAEIRASSLEMLSLKYL